MSAISATTKGGKAHKAPVCTAVVSGDRLVTGDEDGKGFVWSIRDASDVSSQKAVGWLNLLPPILDFVFLTLRTCSPSEHSMNLIQTFDGVDITPP